MPKATTNRLLLLGASGQIGGRLLPRLAEFGEVSAPGRGQFDLTSEESLREAVRAFRPTVILNAAAYTAVDRAESEPELALRVNALAPGTLAEEARRCRALLVHYSTDYVFDGRKTSPYDEHDPTAPLNQYGRSKLLGEQKVAAAGGAFFILRTGWVYAERGSNFLLTMLRLGAERDVLRVVDDQIGTPTPAEVVAQATLRLLRHCFQSADAYESAHGLAGLYHAGCAGQASWYRFALAIFAAARERGLGRKLKVSQVVPVTTEEFPTPAQRPRYSVLSKEKITRAFGLTPPSWEDGLQQVVRELAGANR